MTRSSEISLSNRWHGADRSPHDREVDVAVPARAFRICTRFAKITDRMPASELTITEDALKNLCSIDGFRPCGSLLRIRLK